MSVEVCNPNFMHTSLYGVESGVFGNVGGFDLGTKIFLQQVEHGRALLLYTLMPFVSRCDLLLPKSLTGNKQTK